MISMTVDFTRMSPVFASCITLEPASLPQASGSLPNFPPGNSDSSVNLQRGRGLKFGFM